MNPVYRTIIGLVLAIISITITCNRCQQRRARQYWGPQLDAQVSDIFYQQAAHLTINESERKAYAECCLEKMKVLFPNGMADANTRLMKDSIQAAAVKMGADCAKFLKNGLNIWNDEAKDQLRLKFYSFEEVKLLPEEAKAEYVQCLTYKVTNRFPKGIEDTDGKNALKKFTDTIRRDCLKLIANKYGKAKKSKH